MPIWSRTGLGTAGPLPGAKRMLWTCHPKGHSSPGLKHCVDTPQFAWRPKTIAGGFGSVPPSSKGAGVPALLRTHHWTTFPPSPLVEKVDLGVR